MKITLLFTVLLTGIQFAYSGCSEPISFYGYNSQTQSYQQLYSNNVTPSYNQVSTSGGNFYINLCPQYDHLRINFTNLATLPDGSTCQFAIVNPGDSLNLTIDVCGWGQNPQFTFHVSQSTLQLNSPQTISLPACSSGYLINGISASGGSGQYNYSSWFISGNGTIDQTNPSQPIISNVYYNSSFIVEVSDNTCSISDTIEIISALTDSMYAEVCLLTIDSTNSHNLVTWEKNPNMGVVSYRIHKQSTLTSQYEMIHEQAYSSLSEYVDLNSNASQEIARYKISALDSCGNESTISPNHTTILLSSNLGASSVNLSWNPYEGFSYPNFEIWRSLNGGISYNLLANVANNTYAYIDNNAPQQAYYQVRISNVTGCITTKNSFNQVKSNIVDQAGNSIGISEINSSDVFSIFPNPTNEMFYVKSNQFQTGNKFELVDNAGRIVLSGVLQNENQAIDVSKLSRGIYNLNILGTHSKTMKMVKN